MLIFFWLPFYFLFSGPVFFKFLFILMSLCVPMRLYFFFFIESFKLELQSFFCPFQIDAGDLLCIGVGL